MTLPPKSSLFLFSILALGIAHTAYAATLSLGGPSVSIVGDTLSIPVVLATSRGESANAVSATITYPSALLKLVAVSKVGSIITLWPEEPTIAQQNGTGHIEGVILNPGWSGVRGTVATLLFKAQAAGTASVAFADSQVLANDGKGTNILVSASPTSVLIASQKAATPSIPPTEQKPALSASGGITVTSSTHPNQDAWYRTPVAAFAWNIPAGATAVRLGCDHSPQGTPSVLYAPAIASKKLSLKEGIWYFHIQARTAAGWGSVATFKVKIDTTPPLPVHIQIPHGATSTDPRPIAIFNTTDALSGIDHYTITVNGGGLVRVSSDEVTSNPYALPMQNPGANLVTVVAFDRAGNTASDETTVTVEGIPSPVLDPVRDIPQNDILELSGLATPNARVDVYMKDWDGNTGSQWVRSNGNGAFRVIWKKALLPGLYTVTAQTTDDKGAKSALSPELGFSVRSSFLDSTIARLLFGLLAALVLLGVLWVMRRVYRGGRGGQVAHELIHQQFDELKEALLEELLVLEHARSRRALTVEEERFVSKFKKMLEQAEREIEREVLRLERGAEH